MVPEGERSFEMMTTMTTGDVMVVSAGGEEKVGSRFHEIGPVTLARSKGGKKPYSQKN